MLDYNCWRTYNFKTIKMKNFIVPGILLILLLGSLFWLKNEINTLNELRIKDKLDIIERQDSLHTAIQKNIIDVSQKQAIIYNQKDSIINIQTKPLNEKLDRYHISTDSLPDFSGANNPGH
jgi:hypothetical protein